MGKIIIGLTGKAQSGKTTASKWLINDYGFVRVRFADTLKRMLKKFGLSDEHVDGKMKEEPLEILCGKTVRFAMQTLGTEWGRMMIGEDVWVRAAMNAVSKIPHERVVMDDLRFVNEAQAIKAMGGFIIRTVRPGFEGMQLTGHASETEMDRITADYELSAEDLTTLQAKVYTQMDALGFKRCPPA